MIIAMLWLVKKTITVVETTAAALNNAYKKVIFKNLPFTNDISRVSNTQVDYAHYIVVELSVYNLIE